MKWKLFAAAGGVIVLFAAMVWFAFNRGPLAPVAVEMAAAQEADIASSVFGIGTVEARRSYAIGPIQAGRVLKVHVDHGDTVNAGQLLAEIDPVDLLERLKGAESMLDRTRNAVAVAEAQEREARSRHTVASANAARYRDLVQKNFVSREAAEVRASEASVTQAAVDGAQAALLAARGDVERAARDRDALRRQLANLRLTSPVDGVVVARDSEPGTTVVAGQAVVRVVDPRSLWVRARIDQSRAAALTIGLTAEIVLRSNQGEVLRGRVARVEIESDSVTEERIVAIAFAGTPPLSVGELAEVTIHRTRSTRGLVVPSAAVKRVNQQHGVWRVVDGRTRFHPVKIGVQTLDGMTEVLDGLKAGDRVIAYSSAQLREGMEVRIGKVS
ncbi:MAG: efflux RND transporter periplasmic adaptor subunit [Betaproteobacteria bacterium]|nr:efflux RND transporter periplasmic adaptor subunit [Betaproteobacteria bacterium]